MAVERDTLRDWHRLFGLLLTDFFTDSPFIVEVERDLSEQQQFLDVVILRRGRGRFAGRLPDGLEDLAEHNLITFKSHHEALDAWAMKELIGHYVAYRKLVSRSPSELLPEDRFRLYAVWRASRTTCRVRRRGRRSRRGCMIAGGARTWCASSRPANCRGRRTTRRCTCSARRRRWWGSAGAYRRRSKNTSAMLEQLLEKFRKEGFTMSFTMEDFQRQYVKDHFSRLTPEERREVLQSLPPEEYREALESLPPEEQQEVLQSLPPEKRLAGLSEAQIREYLDRLAAGRPARTPKRRRKK